MEARGKIERSNWVSSFSLTGAARITDYTYRINEKSKRSAWRYNSLNLGVDCGEKHGIVYCDMMGGYDEGRPGAIYVHGRNPDGTDNFGDRFQVPWEDRLKPEAVDEAGDLCAIRVWAEPTADGKPYYRKFLSGYDAVAYIKENLSDGAAVNVRGNLRYSWYNGKVRVKKEVTALSLSRVSDPARYSAKFSQSVLLAPGSAGIGNFDRDRGVLYIDGVVLDYAKEAYGIEIRGQCPFRKQFEFKFGNVRDEKQCRAAIGRIFKVKRNMAQINFDGEFAEDGGTAMITMDDVPQDVKDLIDCGIFTEEEALERCSTNGRRESHMYLTNPYQIGIGGDGRPEAVLRKFEDRYKEGSLIYRYLDAADGFEEGGGGAPFGDGGPEPAAEAGGEAGAPPADDDDMSWLDEL